MFHPAASHALVVGVTASLTFLAYLAVVAAASRAEPGADLRPPPARRPRREASQKIEVVLRPDDLGEVSRALQRARIGAFRASDVAIFEPLGPVGVPYSRGRERVKIELLVSDGEVESAVAAIRRAIAASSAADTELAVFAVEHLVQVGGTRGTSG